MAMQRITWNIADFQRLRKSAGAVELVGNLANATAAACGEGFEAEVKVGASRARGTVVTRTPIAMVRNARDNLLVNNLNAGATGS